MIYRSSPSGEALLKQYVEWYLTHSAYGSLDPHQGGDPMLAKYPPLPIALLIFNPSLPPKNTPERARFKVRTIADGSPILSDPRHNIAQYLIKKGAPVEEKRVASTVDFTLSHLLQNSMPHFDADQLRRWMVHFLEDLNLDVAAT